MTTTPESFKAYLDAPEDGNIEFKEAKQRFGFEELLKYIVALAKGGGGKILLGVTDKRPRALVGTAAFGEPGRTEADIEQKLQRAIPLEEYIHDSKRVLIVHVPARLPGSAWDLEGKYLRRSGDAIVPMTDRDLRRIFAETAPDFSDEICPGVTYADLDPRAIELFRERWAERSNNPRIRTLSDEQVLTDCGLLRDEGVTHAALILLGKAAAVDRRLLRAEVVFEYRSQEAAGPAQDRAEFREGFLLAHDALWERINLRNDRQSYQDGFFRREVATFDELVVREAVLNAVCHRDYRLGGSIFVRQYARRIEVVSPGGFPAGITVENLLDQQAPRNSRLADACLRCGLVERAGQGMNLMFERSIQQSKALPDFHRSSEHQVFLTLAGALTNPAFILFLERVGQATLQVLSTTDFIVLDLLQRDEDIGKEHVGSARRLANMGLLERIGRGRGTRYILSRHLYEAMGESGVYTRRKGLDYDANKALVLQHIRQSGERGATLHTVQQVVPSLSRYQVQALLRDLRTEDKIRLLGKTAGARWVVIDKSE